jgi:hypothetical protein
MNLLVRARLNSRFSATRQEKQIKLLCNLQVKLHNETKSWTVGLPGLGTFELERTMILGYHLMPNRQILMQLHPCLKMKNLLILCISSAEI